MRARLICVGKPKQPHAVAMHDDYAERARKLGLDLRSSWVAEERSGRYSDDHVRERESRRLLEALDPGERLVALDRTGRGFDSESLAETLGRWVVPQAAFALGGPLGHHPLLLDRAEQVWSLGPATLPHELARVVVAEQLYRAMTLLRGVPYHK